MSRSENSARNSSIAHCCKEKVVLTPVPNCIGQHTLASMTRRTRCAWAACPFHLVSSHPVYGSFRCIWPTLHSYFSQTPPELILKWTDAHLFRGHGLLVCLLLKHSHIYPCCKWIVFSLDFFFTFISRTRAWHATWPVCPDLACFYPVTDEYVPKFCRVWLDAWCQQMI